MIQHPLKLLKPIGLSQCPTNLGRVLAATLVRHIQATQAILWTGTVDMNPPLITWYGDNRHKNLDFPRKAGENPEIYSCNIGMEDVPWRNDWPLHHGDSGFNVCVSYSCWFHRTRIASMDRFPTKSSWSQLAQTFQSEPPAHHLIFTERKSENPGLVEVCPTARTRV